LARLLGQKGRGLGRMRVESYATIDPPVERVFEYVTTPE
jgi:uncharacterized protein YndB with AHSA1/START domain